jgi:poly [ADP-ribose] polymerase
MSDKYVKLMCVDHKANCNKYYEMRQISSTEFEALYGREGGHQTRRVYPMSRWDKIYRDKTRQSKKPEPYRDITDLHVEEVVSAEAKITSVNNPVVAALIQKLQAYAKGSIARNYRVSSQSVTPAMVSEAQDLLNEAANIIKQFGTSLNPDEFNELLVSLYHVIPRRMKKVGDHVLPSGPLDFSMANRLLDTEQKNLDVMSQQVSIKDTSGDSPTGENILDAMGITIEQAGDGEIQQVKSRADDNARKIRSVYRITNLHTRMKFDEYYSRMSDDRREKHLLWHGTRNENVLSILQKGLLIRPTGVVTTGSMFGDGIYFAPKFQKSYGYTSARGSYWAAGNSDEAYMTLFWVHLGKVLRINRHNSSCYRLGISELEKRGGYDSVHGARGYDLHNDENIIYRPEQCTIAFLVQVN